MAEKEKPMKYTAKRLHDDERLDSRPKVKNMKIERTCLSEGCHRTFFAHNRFIRLCPEHREGIAW